MFPVIELVTEVYPEKKIQIKFFNNFYCVQSVTDKLG